MNYFVIGSKVKIREAAGLFSKAKNIYQSAAELIDALNTNKQVKVFNTEKEAIDYSVATAEYSECTPVIDCWGITIYPVYEVNLSSDVDINDSPLQVEEHLSSLSNKNYYEPIPKHTFRNLPLSAISETVTAKVPQPFIKEMVVWNLRIIDLTEEAQLNNSTNCVIQ